MRGYVDTGYSQTKQRACTIDILSSPILHPSPAAGDEAAIGVRGGSAARSTSCCHGRRARPTFGREIPAGGDLSSLPRRARPGQETVQAPPAGWRRPSVPT